MKNYHINLYYFLVMVLGLGACSKDFLEPTVTTQKDVATSINTLEDLQGIVLGAYDRMNQPPYNGRNYIVYGEVRSDNAYSNGNSAQFVEPAQFNMLPVYGYTTFTWQQMYAVIANTNIVINAEVEDNESAEVQYVKGQAHTLRALAYIDLLGLYVQQYAGGTLGVPLVLEFNDGNIYPERATAQQVWDQIGTDFQMAADMMNPALDETSSTVITSGAVYALQSRYYLYIKDYEKAGVAAKKVIDSGKYSLTDAASHVASWALKGNSNIIFELAFTETDNLSFNSLYFAYQDTYYGDVVVTNELYNMYEDADVRKELYTVQDNGMIRMTGKYPSESTTDNMKIIRYAEVILTYAEAMAQTGKPDVALTYLNMIPANRNATVYTEATLDNILQERRKEIAMQGQRFYDLMRYEQEIPYVDPGQTFDKAGIPFGDPDLAFPIPQTEISANSSIEQNEGY